MVLSVYKPFFSCYIFAINITLVRNGVDIKNIFKRRFLIMAEMTYASKGVAGSGLGLGIAGTALGLLNGGLGNIFGGWNGAGNCHENMPVNRYEAQQSARIAELETEVKLRDANAYTNGLLNDFRNYVDGKFATVEKEICDQKTYNAVNTATLNCISGQVAQLMSLTKVVIPNSSVCPGWGDVTVSVTPAPTTTA
jgi:hypothetical protein